MSRGLRPTQFSSPFGAGYKILCGWNGVFLSVSDDSTGGNGLKFACLREEESDALKGFHINSLV